MAQTHDERAALEERIAALAPSLAWNFRNRCIATDPIYMEFVIEQGDPAAKNQLLAVRFQTVAAVFRAMADGAEKAAQILGGARSGG
jgi:hypothetical protein